MAYSALCRRRCLASVAALRHSLSSSPLLASSRAPLNPSISSQVQSQQQQLRSSSFGSSMVQMRAFSSSAAPPNGKDYNHWLVIMRLPEDTLRGSPEEITTYEETCAKGLNISLEEAKQRIYAIATFYEGFQVVMTKEEVKNFYGLPGVLFCMPDSYVDAEKKDYGGDEYINGTIRRRPSNSKTADAFKKIRNCFDDEVRFRRFLDKGFIDIAEMDPTDLGYLQLHIDCGLHNFQVIKDELGISPSREWLDHLLSAAVKAKDSERCLQIWEEYERAGLSDNATTYVKMCHALLACGDHQSARQFLNRIPKDDHLVQMHIKELLQSYGITHL